MPELPEVQSVVNYFKPLLSEEKIHKITSPNGYEKVFDTHSFLNINIAGNHQATQIMTPFLISLHVNSSEKIIMYGHFSFSQKIQMKIKVKFICRN